MEQAIASAPVTQRARVLSPVGTSFLGEFFSGFSSPVRQMSGNFRPTWFSEYHLAIIIILLISALLEWMNKWMVSSFMFVLSRRRPRHWADHSSGDVLHSLCGQKKYVYDPELIPSAVHRCGESGSMRACHAVGPGSIPGRDRFPGWGFFGVFLTCKTNLRNL